MKGTYHHGWSDDVSVQEVDGALRAFWGGSARPNDRLVGVSEGDGRTVGELLLLVACSVSAQRVGAAMTTEEEHR